MHIAVTEKNLVLIAELMIEPAGRLVLARVEGNTPPLLSNWLFRNAFRAI